MILLPEEPADESGALIGRPSDPARVRLAAGSTAEFDRLISLPTVVSPFIAGVTTDALGFVEVDKALKVCNSERTMLEGGGDASPRGPHALAAADLEFLIHLDEANGIRLHSGDERTGGGG